jgi:hypothetical protein
VDASGGRGGSLARAKVIEMAASSKESLDKVGEIEESGR